MKISDVLKSVVIEANPGISNKRVDELQKVVNGSLLR